MAVMGRQKSRYAFSLQHVMIVSAPTRLTMANSRASSTTLKPSVSATVQPTVEQLGAMHVVEVGDGLLLGAARRVGAAQSCGTVTNCRSGTV
jgi:hypothetical protein